MDIKIWTKRDVPHMKSKRVTSAILVVPSDPEDTALRQSCRARYSAVGMPANATWPTRGFFVPDCRLGHDFTGICFSNPHIVSVVNCRATKPLGL